MVVKPLVSDCDQIAVKPSLTAARLVPGNQNDGLSSNIEGKSHSPHAVSGIETKLFHVAVLRVLERVHMRTSQHRPYAFQQTRLCRQYRLHIARQLQKLRVECLVKNHDPGHRFTVTEKYMFLKAYSSLPPTVSARLGPAFGESQGAGAERFAVALGGERAALGLDAIDR
jgi:hypothetical protein